ncbi:MAG: AsmA family protein [Hylemonella sp.]|uniref:AsmA family protein n=1 Tax=Hylemonella sp. TaxID=2066020 RepID=UPI0022BF0D7F|nr:AsmA family protein [Hylemonella sp.]MCZ8251299.1 AsmA family protein [Hylemonella sp.]
MKKVLKYLLIALGIFVALVVAVVAYVAATFNPNDYKPQLIQLVQDKTGRTLAIPGEISLTFFPRIGAELGQISLSEPRSTQIFAAAQQLRVSVALLPLLKKEVRVDRVLIDGLDVKLARDARGRFNFDDLLKSAPEAATADKPAETGTQALPRLDIDGITLSRARVEYRDAASGQQLQIAPLEFNTGPIRDGQRAQLALDATLSGQQPELALKLGLRTAYTPALAQQQIKLDAVDFTLNGAAAGLKDLQLKLGLAQAEASASKIDAQGLTLELSAPNPAGGSLALKAQGQASVDLAREAVQLALDGTLDSTTLALKAGVQKFARPAISFDLALGDLDADRYLPKNQPATAAGTPANTPVPSGPEPQIDLSPLNGLDLRGTLKVAALKVMNVKTTGLRLQLKAQNGRAELNPVTASLYQGGVNGSLTADAAGAQRLAAKLDLRGIQIGPLMKDALDQQPLEGRGNVALDVSTGGNTVTQFKRKLNGTVGVQLTDGALNGVDIAGMLRNAKAKLGGGSEEGQASGQQKTDFTEFGASLKITDGVARNDDLSAKTPLLRLGGAGTIFIPEDRLDYTVKATVVPTLQGQGGPELDQLRGLTIPVRLTGPYSDLKWKIDFGGIAGQRKAVLKEETKQKLDAKKEAAKEQLKDKASDKLKDLLKR